MCLFLICFLLSLSQLFLPLVRPLLIPVLNPFLLTSPLPSLLKLTITITLTTVSLTVTFYSTPLLLHPHHIPLYFPSAFPSGTTLLPPPLRYTGKESLRITLFRFYCHRRFLVSTPSPYNASSRRPSRHSSTRKFGRTQYSTGLADTKAPRRNTPKEGFHGRRISSRKI